MTGLRTAAPYEARQCPECGKWIYIATGPFVKGDRTKTVADRTHWARKHLTGAEKALGFPFFPFNDKPVTAIVEGDR